MSYKLVLLFVVVPVFSQTRWTPNKNACPNLIRYPFSLNPLSLIAKSCYNNPNVGAPPNDVVLRAGYPFEQHYVTTEDGYILEIERLPQNKRGAQPVLLMHFLAGSSTVWLDRYNQSLAYALHNEGYDVWAGNVRGTTYSKRHVTLSPNQKEFWDYNLDTIAYYDVSAIVKYIAEETGQGGNIIYGGVSMGCAISYMYLITRPEEANALIRGLVHFSPAAYVYRGRTFRTISYVRNVIPPVAKLLRIRGVFEPEEIFSPFIQWTCVILPHVCKVILDIVLGNDSGQLDPRDLILELSAAIRPISVGQLMQYLQFAGEKKFQKYNYGKDKNLEIYGQEQPPRYDLSKVKKPAFLFYGGTDKISAPGDVQRTFSELGSRTKLLRRTTPDDKIPFNHLGFNYGKNDSTLVFPEVIRLLKKYLQPIKNE